MSADPTGREAIANSSVTDDVIIEEEPGEEGEETDEVLELPKCGHPSRLRRARAANTAKRGCTPSMSASSLAAVPVEEDGDTDAEDDESVEEVLELPKCGHPSRLRRARAANTARRAIVQMQKEVQAGRNE